ncbi:MAG: bifunctional UDP-N-acetylglucosamine diphosphorylase/glucosamine-1-phosphate N-acetyltransferase GlmU [Hyphomicrobiaceae bacterium]
MTETPLLTIVLAAGKGTRMNSARSKVLHPIAGLSMLGHVLRRAAALPANSLAVVIGPDMDAVRREALAWAPAAQIFVQEKLLGTADAVRAARPALTAHAGDVLVMFGDTPFVEAATLARLRAHLEAGAHMAVMGFRAADPAGYGRLLTDAAGDPIAIREHRDASPEERKIDLCNGGGMAFRLPDVMALLDRIGNANAKGEFYLTDMAAVVRAAGFKTAAVLCAESEAMGIDSRDRLAAAEAVFQDRARKAAMEAGVTLIAPETVWFAHDTALGRDVTIEPNVFFGPGVVIEDDVTIRAHCHIEGARIAKGARVGPFARLRPGADLGEDVHVGNFVEVKNARLAAGAKANHLAYVGDGRVGAGANIGAGTIFCNYDGFNKHMTDIGAGAFVGSNSALVAPVRIGDGAYIGSGSVITRDVPADALALERSSQDVRPGWAAKFRARMGRAKRTKS